MHFNMKVLRNTAAIAGMSAMFLIAGVPQAKADDDHRECRERIEQKRDKLHRAVERHGENSRQAEHARHELNEQRERCWNRYHGY